MSLNTSIVNSRTLLFSVTTIRTTKVATVQTANLYIAKRRRKKCIRGLGICPQICENR